MTPAEQALYDALYGETPRAFQWVTFTKHGTIRGALSHAAHGWHPHQSYSVWNSYMEWADKAFRASLKTAPLKLSL
jgi:hypothetical protein